MSAGLYGAAFEQRHHSGDDLTVLFAFEPARFGGDQRGVGSEELAGSGETDPLQRAGGEICVVNSHSGRVRVGVAGDLTEDPVIAARGGKNKAGRSFVAERSENGN